MDFLVEDDIIDWTGRESLYKLTCFRNKFIQCVSTIKFSFKNITHQYNIGFAKITLFNDLGEESPILCKDLFRLFCPFLESVNNDHFTRVQQKISW